MIAVLLTWLAKLGAGGLLDRAADLIEKRAEQAKDR